MLSEGMTIVDPFVKCMACAASLVYSGPISMTLPQGAQVAVTVVDADRKPVSLSMAQAGSQAVEIHLPDGGRAVLITSVAPGYADVLLLSEGEREDEEDASFGISPLALTVKVEPARARQMGDGPLTLELTLPSLDSSLVSPSEPDDDVAKMIAGQTLPGWSEGVRRVGSRGHTHWVRRNVERARVPAGWRLLFPSSGRRRGHEWRYALWEAPARLGRWQWRDENGNEFFTGEFEASAGEREDFVR